MTPHESLPVLVVLAKLELLQHLLMLCLAVFIFIKEKNLDYQVLICLMRLDKIRHLFEVVALIRDEMRAAYQYLGIHINLIMVLETANLGYRNQKIGLSTA